jgi:hypothetical protein
MTPTQALQNLSVAAQQAAIILNNIETKEPEKSNLKSGLVLPSGERVFDYIKRAIKTHPIALWRDDSFFEKWVSIDLEVAVERNDLDYYLVYLPGTKYCGLIWPSHGGAGNCQWRMNDFDIDTTIEAFIREYEK